MVSSSVDDIDFCATGGRVVADFDDGHVPENLKQQQQSSSTKPTTRLVQYPRFLDRPPCVKVYNDVVDTDLVDALYDHSVSTGMPWGTYVTMQAVQDFWKTNDKESSSWNNDETSMHTLALRAVASFLSAAMSKATPSLQYPAASSTYDADSDDESLLLWNDTDMAKAHGVAVWGLSAQTGSQVPYHLDYAEQIRYASGLIVPPVLAGTLQCTRGNVQGGAYCVHFDGLDHYRKHGYKGARSGSTDNELLQQDDKWIQIPYRYNRLICQSGHLPHLSTKIESLPVDASGKTRPRVIIGFNAFLPDIGPMVQRAPEHSDAFRRQVQVQRWLGQTQRLNAKQVQQNPHLAKLLVLAKRQKVKQEFLQAQNELTQAISPILPQTVRQLEERFGRTDGTWPNATDVQVHVSRLCRQGKLRILQSSHDKDERGGEGWHVDPEDVIGLGVVSEDN